MKKLLTIHDTNQFPFLQMPQVFYEKSKYESMRLESKVAYTLMANLLSLSIKNNWTNDKGEVYVKFSRKTLMEKLGFKGTQKAAAIMKELVDFKLIFIKRLGLNKCNEIYLYAPDCEPRKAGATKEPAPSPVTPAEKCPAKKPLKAEPQKQTQAQEAPTPITPEPRVPSLPAKLVVTDPRPVDLAIITSPIAPAHTIDPMVEVQDLLEKQIHLEDLRQTYDPDFVDEIANNITEMFLNTNTRIGQQDKPATIMRGALRKLKMYHIEYVIDRFREVSATTEILSPKRYLQTMIYNSVYEASTRMIGHIRYNFGYC